MTFLGIGTTMKASMEGKLSVLTRRFPLIFRSLGSGLDLMNLYPFKQAKGMLTSAQKMAGIRFLLVQKSLLNVKHIATIAKLYYWLVMATSGISLFIRESLRLINVHIF